MLRGLAFALLLLRFSCSAAPVVDPMSPSTETSRRPVILVHGFKDDAAKMGLMARRLRTKGWEVFTPTLAPSWGQIGIDALAGQLTAFVDANLQGATEFDLVGFSMGGLVCRYYLQRLGGMDRVRRFIGISVPNHGTSLARLWPGRGSRQMQRRSAFLSELNQNSDRLKAIQCTSLWTPFDLIILPASSSRVPFARNERMWVLAHPLMVWQTKCVERVAQLLLE